jgi:amino acid transporter
MTLLDTTALTSWSVLTAICMVVIGLVYRRFSKIKSNESHTS